MTIATKSTENATAKQGLTLHLAVNIVITLTVAYTSDTIAAYAGELIMLINCVVQC